MSFTVSFKFRNVMFNMLLLITLLASDNIQELSEAYHSRESRNSACWTTSKTQGSYLAE